VRLALSVCLKNICDGVGCQDESNGIPLYPPLFWLDNIFNDVFRHFLQLIVKINPYTYSIYSLDKKVTTEHTNNIFCKCCIVPFASSITFNELPLSSMGSHTGLFLLGSGQTWLCIKFACVQFIGQTAYLICVCPKSYVLMCRKKHIYLLLCKFSLNILYYVSVTRGLSQLSTLKF
jgi:hypothetical protein